MSVPMQTSSEAMNQSDWLDNLQTTTSQPNSDWITRFTTGINQIPDRAFRAEQTDKRANNIAAETLGGSILSAAQREDEFRRFGMARADNQIWVDRAVEEDLGKEDSYNQPALVEKRGNYQVSEESRQATLISKGLSAARSRELERYL